MSNACLEIPVASNNDSKAAVAYLPKSNDGNSLGGDASGDTTITSSKKADADIAIADSTVFASREEARHESEIVELEEGIETPADEQKCSGKEVSKTSAPPSQQLTGSDDDSSSSLDNVCPICLDGYSKGTMLFASKQCREGFLKGPSRPAKVT